LLPALWPYGEGVGIEDRARGPSLESLSNPLLDWTLIGYAGITILSLSAGYLVWNGTISLDPTSIYKGVKRAGLWVWSVLTYFSSTDDGTGAAGGSGGTVLYTGPNFKAPLPCA